MDINDIRSKADRLAERAGVSAAYVYGGAGLVAILILATVIGLTAGGGGSANTDLQLGHMGGSESAPTLGHKLRYASEPVPTKPINVAIVAASATAKMPGPMAAHDSRMAVMPPAKLAPAPSAATSSAASASGVVEMEVLLLPSATKPAGIKPQSATMKVSYAPSHSPQDWTMVGAVPVSTMASNFSTKAPSTLGGMVPNGGLVRDTWSFWFKVGNSGSQVSLLRLKSPHPVLVAAEIDGAPSTATTMDFQDRANTHQDSSISTVGLQKGWHRMSVSITRNVSEWGDFTALLEVYMRGPDDSAPVALSPSAAVPGHRPGGAQ